MTPNPPPAPSVAALFETGNYTSAALRNDPAAWQTYASLGLLGKTQEAIAGLERFNHPEARFYSAAASWIAGDDRAAIRSLKSVNTPHANKLLALIQKPKINVLSQLDRGSQWDFITAIQADPKFSVQNIGFRPQDTPNKPYADIRRCYSPHSPPDFYLAKLVEWHLLPPNLQELQCPIFGHTADYDLHIQTVHPWLQIFDQLITTDETEWNDVRQLSSGNVVTFPKAFGLAADLPEIPSERRPIDVFISGTALHPYHPDKALLLHQVLAMPDIQVKFLNGFLGPANYLKLLGLTKVGFTYVRHPGAMPTRGLESLAMGAAIAVQTGSALLLFAGENEGVLTYDLAAQTLPGAIRAILAQWPDFEQRARRGASVVRKEFALPLVASQYFRFLTVLAAFPTPERRLIPPQTLDQKRSILLKGWIQKPRVYRDLRVQSSARWSQQLLAAQDPRPVIDMTREMVLEFAAWAYPPVARDYEKNFDTDLSIDRALLDSSLELFRRAVRRFPDCLVLRFNWVRAALHFGSPNQVSEALRVAEETVALPRDSWSVELFHDVFPWDYFSQFFNYRAYFDEVTRGLQTREPDLSLLSRLILASLHYYLSFYSASSTHARVAAHLEPDFPFYQLRCARRLIAEGSDFTMAARILVRLAQQSMLCTEAFQELESLRRQGFSMPAEFQTLAEAFQRNLSRVDTAKYGVENWEAIPLQMPSDDSLPPPQPTPVQSSSDAPTSPLPASSPNPAQPRILFLSLEFANWQNARRLAYPAQLGLDEGLDALQIEHLTLPLVFGLTPKALEGWFRQARELTAGKQFDQVWLELVHSPWTEETLAWAASLAPVRVGFIMESLRYQADAYDLAPQLRSREALVQTRLRHVTHAVAVDEEDAARLNQTPNLSAIWWPQTAPARFIRPLPSPSPNPCALFSGQVYGQRAQWLQRSDLGKLLVHVQHLPEDATDLPYLFDEANRAYDAALASGAVNPSAASCHHAALRALRSDIFSSWLQSLQAGSAVVNLPSLFQGYAGRIYETMAAGRPCISWRVSQRPQTCALFEENSEILLFSKDSPEELAEQIRRVQKDPLFARQIAERAQQKIKAFHTVEKRVQQILRWIESNEAPSFSGPATYPAPAAIPGCPDLTILPSPAPVPAELTQLQLTLAQTLTRTGQLAPALSLLESITTQHPGHAAAHARLAQAALALQRLDLFKTALDRALQIEPAHPHALRLLLDYSKNHGDLESTAGLTDLLLQRCPNDIALRAAFTALSLESSSPGAPSLSLPAPDPSDPSDSPEPPEPPAPPALAPADGPWIQNHFDNAKRTWAALQARKARPRPPVADIGQLDQARALMDRKQWRPAWDAALQALRERPFHPEAWWTLAEIAQQNNFPQLACTCAQRASEAAPKLKPPISVPSPKKNLPAPAADCPFILPEPPATPRLSVCLIARNEEHFLAACLESIRPIAWQIVVVDTGSTDRTVEIARQFDAEIRHFPWEDDFSSARNAALEHARGDWVLILDADEQVSLASHAALLKEMKNPAAIAYRLPLVDVGKENEGCSYVPRLFRNAPGLFFSGIIHEQITRSLDLPQKQWGLENRLGAARLHHYGYSKEIIRERNKNPRNIQLLERGLQDNPRDPNLLLNLGLELVRAGKLRSGTDFYWEAYAIMAAAPPQENSPELREVLLTQLAIHLMAAQNYPEVIRLLQGPLAKSGGLTASMHFTLALAFLKTQQPKESAAEMRHCLAKRRLPALSPILPDIHKARPHHCLAQCLWMQKQIPQADRAFQAALLDDPTSRPARLDYARFLAEQNRSVEALQHLHALVNERPAEPLPWQIGGFIALSQPEYLEFAVDWTAEALQNCPGDPSLLRQRAEALLLSGDWDAALPLWVQLAPANLPSDLAAMLICGAATGSFTSEFSNAQENEVSAAFLKWYRRVVQSPAAPRLHLLNSRLHPLRTVIPTAVNTLDRALAEAALPEARQNI